MKKLLIIPLFVWVFVSGMDQDTTYKKRVLENIEIDLLTSFYSQDGENAAVCGGRGSEKLSDFASSIVVSVPLNDDDVLTIDAGISAYTSASSSNIDPFDGSGTADPFQASTGASSGDVWLNGSGTYTHSSDDRNGIWSGKLSVSNEFDYFSFGIGGDYTRLFNSKNTEVSINGTVYLDSWQTIYPVELRPFLPGGSGLDDRLFRWNTITGNPGYDPKFTGLENTSRNSYTVGFGFSQILSEKLQVALMIDLMRQEGLLSTPFQRVYFQDYENSYIGNFHLADDIERMPDKRSKVAFGARLNYYLNERVVFRTYYRYYADDWNVTSHTASIEMPFKISNKFTLYPSYRFYYQSAADYFAPYDGHISTQQFYTSDYDLSEFIASQYGMGIKYSDLFSGMHLWKLGIKSIDLDFQQYERDSGLKAFIVTAGAKFIIEYQ